jgi:single-strand DNA-binding protein
MNKVVLIGNLTRDPELSKIPSGISVCKFSIAVNRKFANADGQRDTDFFNITTWRGLGENCAKFLKKGNKVCVIGQIQTRIYEQDGVKKYVTDIIADEVEFLTPKDTAGGTGDIALQPVTDDSLPF